MAVTRVAIHGAGGRMGKRLIALGSEDKDLQLVAALEYAAHPQLGQDAGTVAGVAPLGLPLTAQADVPIDALIDFSSPGGAGAAMELCYSRRIPLVMATTGLEPPQQTRLREIALQIPVVWSPNMSSAVNLGFKLATVAAEALKNHASGVDVEILERHHRFKEDAPSGTALKFGQLIGDVLGIDRQVHGRHGATGARTRNEIGYHAIRTGDNPGEHTIVFGMLGETIEVTVRASNRDCYALGALSAAKFVAGKPAGLYTMFDVLGLD
ncbi:MAG: 4-hydroxy-tetrahydrodipicolinate reductase [Pirellulales bacterium]